ncbi:hypothetical protein J40TS1_18120 [Paenibacillus montaniterrae]|uniref:Uncharacterized protein n=1 Tax=Paenibacillus montaniterrae TaxID=429341 RepID=A0A919YMF4_9BACL|nr:hypothetical protein J40TS1_18120 [Paenibacillus montaniterrae]
MLRNSQIKLKIKLDKKENALILMNIGLSKDVENADIHTYEGTKSQKSDYE